MTEIRAFQSNDLPQLTQIINIHISMLITGWGLPGELILSHMEKNPDQPVIDPWVIERKTLCALVGEKLVGAAHLLRYGGAEPVGENHHKHGDIAWLVFDPEFEADAKALLAACHAQMKSWEVKSLGTWESGLSIPCFTGISDNWPHIGKLFYEAGYRPNPERAEAVFGGTLDTILALPRKDILGTLKQEDNKGLKRFYIHKDGQIAFCIFDAHLGLGKPALHGWAELCEIYVLEAWQRQGIGSFLLQEMADYLLAQGINQIVFSVVQDNVTAIAFYRSLGWDAFSRSQDGWEYKGKL